MDTKHIHRYLNEFKKLFKFYCRELDSVVKHITYYTHDWSLNHGHLTSPHLKFVSSSHGTTWLKKYSNFIILNSYKFFLTNLKSYNYKLDFSMMPKFVIYDLKGWSLHRKRGPLQIPYRWETIDSQNPDGQCSQTNSKNPRSKGARLGTYSRSQASTPTSKPKPYLNIHFTNSNDRETLHCRHCEC